MFSHDPAAFHQFTVSKLPQETIGYLRIQIAIKYSPFCDAKVTSQGNTNLYNGITLHENFFCSY